MIPEDTLLFTGFDDCIIGIAERKGETLAVYDYYLIVNQLVNEEGLSEEEAIEHIDYNMQGAWVGEQTPIILYPL